VLRHSHNPHRRIFQRPWNDTDNERRNVLSESSLLEATCSDTTTLESLGVFRGAVDTGYRDGDEEPECGEWHSMALKADVER
jgi:hypothetical protein